MIKEKEINQFFKEGTSLLSWLPWYNYEDELFSLADGSLGKIWEVEQVPGDLKSDEELSSLSKAIETLLQSLPEGCTCQVLLRADDHIDDMLDKYQQETKIDSGYPAIAARSKVDYLKQHKAGLFLYHTTQYMPKRIRLLFTLRYFPSWIKPTLVDKAIAYFTHKNLIKEKFQAHYESKIKPTMKQTVEVMEENMKRMEMPYHSFDAQDLINFVFPILNPRRYQQYHSTSPKFNSQEPIRDQVLLDYPKASGLGLDFEGIKTSMVSVDTLPSFTFPGMFSGEGEKRVPIIDVIPNLIIAINIYKGSQIAEEGSISRVKSMSHFQRFTLTGTESEASAIIGEDASRVLTERFTENVSILRAQIHFITWDENEMKLRKSIEEIYNYLHYVGCEGVRETMIGAPLFLQCLPLNFSPTSPPLRFTGRARRILSSNLSDMLPFYGTYRGGKSPIQLFLNRRGEPAYFDFFENPNALHFIIAGITGSGKSFWTNNAIMDQMRMGARFYVLDKGASYKRICNLNQGQYIEVNPDEPICMNPFIEKELTSEKQSFLKSLLAEMAAGGEERWAIDREEIGCIDAGIRAAYEKYTGDKELTLSDVAQVIAQEGTIGKRVAAKLQPFLVGGSYGGFFDGQNQFDINKEFTVFELGGLDAKKDLQIIMLMNIMYFIRNEVAKPELRGIRKFLLIDEAWTLLSTENTASFLKEAFKTYRKYGCSAGAITQQTQDLVGTAGGRAVLANAPNRILLKQSTEVIDQVQKDLGLTDTEAKMLKTVTTVKGKFSEALLKTDEASGIIRYVSDPVSYWLYTTNPQDTAYLEKKKEEANGNMEKALQVAAQEHPHGV